MSQIAKKHKFKQIICKNKADLSNYSKLHVPRPLGLRFGPGTSRTRFWNRQLLDPTRFSSQNLPEPDPVIRLCSYFVFHGGGCVTLHP